MLNSIKNGLLYGIFFPNIYTTYLNYFLRGNIVKQISEKLYIDFIQEKIKLLDMQNTYFEEIIGNK